MFFSGAMLLVLSTPDAAAADVAGEAEVMATAVALPILSPAPPSAPLGREVLPNGVTIIVRPNSFSNVVGMELVSRFGTRFEEPAESGLANLTLRCVLDGTSTRSRDALHSWFEDRGSSLQGQSHPDYSEIGTSVMAPDFVEMARIMADLAQDAALTPAIFTAEHNEVLRQIGSSTRDEQGAAYSSLRTLLADSTAYGRSEAGLVATVSTLSSDDVHAFYLKLFAPQELVVVVSGAVPLADTLKLLRGLFAGIPARTVSPPPQGIHTVVHEPSSMVTAGYGDEAWIMLGYLTPGVRDPDYAAAAVLNAIIGGENSGLLPSLFRNQNGVYESGSFVQPFAYQTHIVAYVRADPILWDQERQKMRPVVDEFYRQMKGIFDGIREHGVTDSQVRAGREFLKGQYMRARERNRECAGYLGWYEAIGLGAGFDERFLKEVDAVSAREVNRLAATCLGSMQAAAVVMLPRPRAEDAQ